MKFVTNLFAAITLALVPGLAAAQDIAGVRTVVTESWVEEWDPASQSWVRIAQDPAELRSTAVQTGVNTFSVNGVPLPRNPNAARYASPQTRPSAANAVAAYGPFRVLDDRRAAIVGPTGRMSPAYFDAMLRDHPELEVLELLEAPGTNHDIANLAVGRRIREAGLRTHVPNGGSVRSGAVELFLAGTTKSMDDGAEFAVHSWLDSHGREPDDFAADHEANRMYLDYYVEMGMSEKRAREFYAMTNSVPHHSALWLGADDMRRWVKPADKAVPAHRLLDPVANPAPIYARLDQPVELPVIDLAIDVQLATVERADAGTLALPSIDYADISTATLARLDVDRLDS
ncbi:MAG: alpha/beta hydrolase [Pseudomonadota bacterium]